MTLCGNPGCGICNAFVEHRRRKPEPVEPETCGAVYRDPDNGWGGVRCEEPPEHEGPHRHGRVRWRRSPK